MLVVLMKIELIQWQLSILYNSIKDSNLNVKDFLKNHWNYIDNKRESGCWITLNYFINLIDKFTIKIVIVADLDDNKYFSYFDVWHFIILSVHVWW
jgi:hypothetical protein